MAEYRFEIKSWVGRWLNRRLAEHLGASYIRTDGHCISYYLDLGANQPKSGRIDWQDLVDVYCFGRHLSLQFAVPAQGGYQLEEVVLDLSYLDTLPEQLESELQQQWQHHVDIEMVRLHFNNIQAGVPFSQRQFVARP